MVFYNQTSSPGGEVQYSAMPSAAGFAVRLEELPPSVDRLIFTASVDGNGTMGQIASFALSISQGAAEGLALELAGSDFAGERAIIAAEIYRKDGVWRLMAVAQGFNGGLPDLLAKYGGVQEGQEKPSPAPQRQPAPASEPPQTPPPAPEPPQPTRVILKKGEKVSLKKKPGQAGGEIVINLNWSRPAKKGLFAPKAIDLDLGCLFELTDGTRGVVQALGRAFGSLEYPPYIALDGDDRTGDVSTGENLRINVARISEIRRFVVYCFIYEGVADWRQADGVATVRCPGNPEIVVRMDEHGSKNPMCAIALFENSGGDSFTVERVVRFFRGHKDLDQAFGWGINWVPGRK